MLDKCTHNETVAEFIAHKIKLSGKSQAQIARELGYDKPNIITMFKQGKTRIPLDKVGVIADALEINPALLLNKVMGEYMPETLASLQCVLKGLELTQNELELIEAYRRVSAGKDVSTVICDKTILAVVMVD
jgi:transcriptional regulator with XRE-family HTH domain